MHALALTVIGTALSMVVMMWCVSNDCYDGMSCERGILFESIILNVRVKFHRFNVHLFYVSFSFSFVVCGCHGYSIEDVNNF